MTSQELIRKRASLKGTLTRFKSFLDNIDQENTDDLIQLELRVKKLSLCLDSFEEIQGQLEILDEDTPENYENANLERDNFEQEYFSLEARARRLLLTNNTNTANVTTSAGGQGGTSGVTSQIINNIKLPSINLPSFDGSYNQWLYFKDTFNSIVHTNITITNVQKFHYLRSSLKGDAAEIIKSLEISADNYNVAWNLLKERYENKILLVNNHVKALFNLPSLNKESHVTLRSLVDNLNRNIRALEVLDQPVNQWDTLLIYMVSNKLDPVTRREWERINMNSTLTLPTFNELKTFLSEKCSLLETLNSTNKVEGTRSFLLTEKNDISCSFCTGNHYITRCSKFLNFTPDKRYIEAKSKNLCSNCLKSGHANKTCTSSNCKTCNKRHHTLLHKQVTFIQPNNTNNGKDGVTEQSGPSGINYRSISNSETTSTNNIESTCTHAKLNNQILLCTALIQVLDKHGKYHETRALLDSGSTSHLITQELANKLQLTKKKTNLTIYGINKSNNDISDYTTIKFKSNNSSFQTNITCLIISKITGNIPSVSFNQDVLEIPQNITLADPNFNISDKVDILIGADIFWHLLRVGQLNLGKNKPIIQNTLLGWIISGQIPQPHTYCASTQYCNLISTTNNDKSLDKTLNKFWEIEEFSKEPPMSSEEQAVENFFKETTQRTNDGRFIVRLPLKKPCNLLGDSRQIALKRLFSIERKLNNDDIRLQYVHFMNEYLTLGHMSKLPEKCDESNAYYIPHHFIQKETSLTTKLRVVFDASCKTTSGYSINDLQMVGPTIQQDLISIILRFRSHQYILAGDITKMYRQILIHPDDRSLQRILWRFDASQPVEVYELNTVTYGTVSAPFLAIRCLHEIGLANINTYPNASKAILNDFYVDDLLTGSNDINSLSYLYKDVSTLLKSGGFSLNKWVSNSPELLNNIQNSQRDAIINIGKNDQTYSLGLLWQSKPDMLSYDVKLSNTGKKPTKRLILSSVAQIFDPLGLVGPTIIKAKILIQKLWQLQISWDEPLPLDISYEWELLSREFHFLNNFKIPRFVLCTDAVKIDIHGFADASTLAYGACIFIRSEDTSGNISVCLLCAKSRVAPLKFVTIPRLELCAALLLARLVNKVKTSWNITFNETFLWSDSTIALSWIHADPATWKIFVANRVSELQSITSKSNWRYIHTSENPADLISRGLSPKNLVDNSLWWNGPEWLIQPASTLYCIVEMKAKPLVSTVAVNDDTSNIFEIYSSFSKMQRVIAYVLRFKSNCFLPKGSRQCGPLRSNELKQSLTMLIILVQSVCFVSEITDIKSKGSLNKKSRLLNLNPFLDNSGVLRVGGRLRLSNFDMDKKYPIILPREHTFTNLLVTYYHKCLLHAGPQLLLSSIREKYWIPSGRNLVRNVVHNCIRCFRTRPTSTERYKMADLPNVRVTPSRPFVNVGIDYCGPVYLRDRPTRNFKITKAYICLIVCVTTKAVHLELTSDLTTEAFLACLYRFIARRGKCQNIYSDNATNFIGANKLFKKFIASSENDIATQLGQRDINWHFIPPRSPHFGGLWEAGVKSVKHHLRRVIGESKLTFEQYCTILYQVEACLNSRPLYPLSSDPTDPTPITPAHFIIGESFNSAPTEDLSDRKEAYLSRYKRCQKIVQDLWRRWSKEYVSELQVRCKWKQNHQQLLKPGSLVIIKDDHLPPLKWSLGRVLQLHPGDDGVTRVVTVKTSSGVFKRPVVKMCILPSGN